MFKTVLVILCLLISSSLASASTLRLTWSPFETEADKLTVWERVAEGRVSMADNIPITDVSVEVDVTDDICHHYFMTSKYNGIESEAGNLMTWCPEILLPEIPIIIRPGEVKIITIQALEE